MSCPENLSGWAGDILDSLSETGIPTGKVVTWLQSNLGKFNVAIEEDFYLNDSGCITGADGLMDVNHSGIYTEMYYCDYYRQKATELLGAASFDWTLIEGDEQGTVRKVSKNEQAKTYNQMSKKCKENLKQLIDWYRAANIVISPQQTLYNDRIGVADAAVLSTSSYPPVDYYSFFNVIYQSVQ